MSQDPTDPRFYAPTRVSLYSPPTPDQFRQPSMAPTSLLRYVFRHGPHARSHGAGLTPDHESRATPRTSLRPQEQEARPNSPAGSDTSDEPESPLAHKNRPERRTSTVLNDIAEESSSDDDASIAESFATLGLDIDNFTTRELLAATLKEAKTNLLEHLETVNTTLEILRALDGFSATITAVKEEMGAKTEMCEEKLKAMRDVERFANGFQYLDD